MAADNSKRDEKYLERYGVWVKTGPDERSDQTETNIELMDIEDGENGGMLITEEEEKLLGQLEESSLPDFGDIDDDAFSTERPGEELVITNLDEPELDAAVDGESTELLHKIEGELKALRYEIRQLKDELTGLHLPAVRALEDQNAEGGFFDKEDDETIALTGDELDNILDSAEMTEKSVQEPEEEMANAAKDDGFDLEVEEIIDLSNDAADSGIDDIEDFDHEGAVAEDDPALSILGSPEEPEDGGDPDTIEINIPGLDETVDPDDGKSEKTTEEPVVSIDDITEDFEEITDLDDIEVDENAAEEIPSIDEVSEEILQAPTGDVVLTEIMDDEESFDEGEEVEIDLTHPDDGALGSDDLESEDIEMEEISLEDLGLNDTGELLENEPGEAGESDVLALDEQIDSDAGIEAAAEEDVVIEQVDNTPEISLDDGSEPDELDIQELGIGEIEDDDFDELPGTDEVDLDSLKELTAAPDLTEESVETLVELPEVEPENAETLGVGPMDETAGIGGVIEDELPEITVEDDSADALDEIFEFEPNETPDQNAESLEIDPLPTGLREEIKEVLKYMDRLLESLPDDKIQEFARSEHFEVYKKIFEELGISE